MKFLAFDTSTERLSLAVGHGEAVWAESAPGGAQSSATLIPALLALLQQANLRLDQLDAIVFGSGPGSFTGLRTACSVAQGLALGANLPVLPVSTLLAVAEEARHQHGATRVLAALDARMDEVYHAAFEWTGGADPAWQAPADFSLGAPESLQLPAGWVLAGTAAQAYPGRVAGGDSALNVLPTASALLRLAPALWRAGHAVRADEALPLYIRDKVAKTTLEREAEKAAKTTTP
ncbi:tRNA (adenosine(37)-N6)-threonylcarbamoyltransferase complex dimerization subunit type 1 TsaB [Curvibacter sp. HBC61]|uniref:tRNA (Adenosine(37)-N6)-threonylcarbamoyltransferase complex dimerization subunit type 1 TsaB n=1 Tax=Curvibacter cyanobacteriorum TaxID=3026422 RepID=A0ABT5MZ89_9BURK|nr:tRNA (adenosine(37)-N6)-threonylcarbamoyltransferase complex dimerization subunit type 1 TsaB [Curvibacter sp. HBC61]MDD0839354.1 tRNA (adenosine(37)-N6)-threonylcarbamoyltransferase complex dimerization subunit type 1 TsaB [Curvibacter sp. HBC61]